MRIIILNMITTGLLLFAAGLCYSQTWLPVGAGVDCNDGAYIWDINISDDNSKLYIAGTINRDGECNPMRATLSWDGNSYNEIAYSYSTSISTLAFDYQGKTYSSGYLVSQSSSNPINYFNYKDDEGNWSLFPSSIGGHLYDYFIHDGLMYLAGSMPYCGGNTGGLVCTFDGEQVLPYYQPNEPHDQTALGITFYHDTLYIAGIINSQNSTQAYNGYSNLLKVVNGQLEKVAQGFTLQGMGAAVEVLDERLYVGGWLQTTDNPQFHSIYYYQNGQLQTLPEEPNDLIFAMTTYQNALYVAGGFTQIGNMPCNNVARWDGQEWTCLCSEPFKRILIEDDDTLAIHPCSGQCIKDIVVWNDTLYIAGAFNHYGEIETKRIAKLDMALSQVFPVSVTEQTKQKLKLNVYPNPANDKLNIHFPHIDKWQVSIYNMQGSLILSENTTNLVQHSVSINSLPSGIYTVLCKDEKGKVFKQKIIKH